MGKQIDEIIDTTRKLISYETIKENQKERNNCIDFIIDYFSDVDVVTKKHVINGSPSLIVSFNEEYDSCSMIHGHIDVVNVQNESAWQPNRKNGKLYGRGAADMKGGVAALMKLMKELSSGSRPNLCLMITSDEEIGGFDGARHLMNKGVYQPSFALSAEPNTRDADGLDIVYNQKGVCWLDVAAFGTSAHGSRPWKGANAIEKGYLWYEQIKEIFKPLPDGDSWKTSMNLGSMQGGVEFNTVPSSASMKIDIRYTENMNPSKFLDQMINSTDLEITSVDDLSESYDINRSKSAREIGQNLDSSNRPDILLKVVDDTPSMYTDPNNEYVKNLSESIRYKTEQEPNLIRETGASDMAFFSNNGIPCVVFGPKGGNIHNPDEYLDIDSLAQFYNIMLHHFSKSAS